MPYCGQFGCSCCSDNCERCKAMRWKSELDEHGICEQCRLTEERDANEKLKNLCKNFFEDQGFGHREVIEQADLGKETREFLIQLGRMLGVMEG